MIVLAFLKPSKHPPDYLKEKQISVPFGVSLLVYGYTLR